MTCIVICPKCGNGAQAEDPFIVWRCPICHIQFTPLKLRNITDIELENPEKDATYTCIQVKGTLC